MDAAGKDSAIKHVMSGVNPQGCEVYSFKHPSAEELEHDFLWRTTRCLPGAWADRDFQPLLLRRSADRAGASRHSARRRRCRRSCSTKKTIWDERYRSINDLESHLHRNGTRILKFFLHVSKEEQRQRFLDRLDDPDKNWKFGAGDLGERELWDDYMVAYEDCLRATSTKHAPWFVIPADDKKNARLLIAEAIVETLEGPEDELSAAGQGASQKSSKPSGRSW